VGIAGLATDFRRDRQINRNLEANWAVVKDWKETFRYDPGITRQQAFDLYSAIKGRNGVLQWIRKRW
jgi:hypothetical protein